MTVRDIDHGARRVVRELDRLALAPPKVSVGIHADEGAQAHEGSSLTVADVAALAEFGTREQPARPFLRSVVDGTESEIGRDLARAAEAAVRGHVAREAFEQVGERVAEAMRAQMARTAPLSPETVRRKGHGRPLEDSGALRRAVRAKVEGGGA